MTSGAKAIDLRPNLIDKRYWGMKRGIQVFFLIIPSYHPFGVMAILCEKVQFSQNLIFGDRSCPQY